MIEILKALRIAKRYSDYRPQPVTLWNAYRWIRQFKPSDRKYINQLLDAVIYLSEAIVKKILVEQNEALMRRLELQGVPANKLIYVQIHEAGSSSPVMLNLLRDAAGLEQRGCRFLDGNDTLGLNKVTNALGDGAIIYIDDFVGTGVQFCDARDFTAQHIIGTFSEFLLVPSICEEGIYQLARRDIETFAGHVHSKAERPLHANSNVFNRETKRRLIEVCAEIEPRMGLGWLDSATMVVLYRNAPDNVPVVFRGSQRQKPYVGIFPRSTDLPILELS
jgi:hypothetical protein